MKQGRHERTLKAKERILVLRQLGYSYKEIAKKCKVSGWTIYHLLDDVSKETGIPRDELLYRPRKSCGMSDCERSQPLDRFRFDELLAGIETMKDEINSILEVLVLE